MVDLYLFSKFFGNCHWFRKTREMKRPQILEADEGAQIPYPWKIRQGQVGQVAEVSQGSEVAEPGKIAQAEVGQTVKAA
jgi:hypothetical protein